METGTFPNEGLQAYLEKHFVPVKFTSGPDAEQFYRFGITIEPTFLVIDAEGNIIYKKIGFFEADLLMQQLDKARKKAAHKAGKLQGLSGGSPFVS